MEDKRGQLLPPNIALRYKARQTASSALRGKLFDAKYNSEVLDDPDGSGFLVYALAATAKKDEILTGGHYRVTVSSDGSHVERVDLLSAFVRMKEKIADLKALVSTQHSSNLPVETWFYSSSPYHVPVLVGTADETAWLIENGKVRKLSKAEMDEAEPKKQKK